MNRGANTKENWEQKHIQMYDLHKPYDFTIYDKEENKLSYHYVAGQIISQNKDSVNNKSVYEIGCAGGDFAAYLKTVIVPEFDISASDFSETSIAAARRRCSNVNYFVNDFLETKINGEYGFICSFECIEHIDEGKNYEFLNDILEHCEYCLISTVTTLDNCGNEHLSHYTFDTFEEKGYNVVWKTKLSKIDMSATGDYNDYYYVMFLLKGKL